MIPMSMEAARVNAGYTQEQAGKLFGVHPQTLAKWEIDNSKMPYDMIQKIPDVYKVPANHIFFGNTNEFIRYLHEGKFSQGNTEGE